MLCQERTSTVQEDKKSLLVSCRLVPLHRSEGQTAPTEVLGKVVPKGVPKSHRVAMDRTGSSLMGTVQHASVPVLGSCNREEAFPAVLSALRAAVSLDFREVSSQEGAIRDFLTVPLKEVPAFPRDAPTFLKDDLITDLTAEAGLRRKMGLTIRKVDQGSHREVDPTFLKFRKADPGVTKVGGLDNKVLQEGLTSLKEGPAIHKAEDPNTLSRAPDFKGQEVFPTSHQEVQAPSKAAGRGTLKGVLVFHREGDYSHRAYRTSADPTFLKDKIPVSLRTNTPTFPRVPADRS